MAVERDARDVIGLKGDCGVEDAEALLSLLLSHPGAAVDWSACRSVHAAVVQVLLATAPPLTGAPCGDPFLERWLAPLLRPGRTSA